MESLNYHPILTDPSCFRNDELDTKNFIHVDDGLLFGPSTDILRLIELLSEVMMRALWDDWSDWASKISLLADPRRDCRAWPGRLETCAYSKCEENANDKVTGRVGEQEKRAVYRTAVEKLCCTCTKSVLASCSAWSK